MAEEPKKIIVDDDWKAEARREKERVAQQAQTRPGPRDLPRPDLIEIINLLVTQAMVGFGMLTGPGGERIPPHLETAKYYIDLLQVLDEKTKGNLSADEKKTLDTVLYELRMRFVQLAAAATSAGMPPPGAK